MRERAGGRNGGSVEEGEERTERGRDEESGRGREEAIFQ